MSGVSVQVSVKYVRQASGYWLLVSGSWPACDEPSRVEARSEEPTAKKLTPDTRNLTPKTRYGSLIDLFYEMIWNRLGIN